MKKNRVLYFDDDAFAADILAGELELYYCWEITVVSKIDDLFQELRDENNTYNVLIMEIMAPTACCEEKLFTKNDIRSMEKGMNTGVVLAKKIWATEMSYTNVPVLFYSAKIMEILPNNGRNCYYLQKPTLTKVISDQLHQLLNQNN